MVVDGEGRFISQRRHPELARVRVELEPAGLRVRAPGMPVLTIPADGPGAERRRVTIWNDRCAAVSAGTEAAAWFGEILGLRCELVRMADNEVRQVDRRFARVGEIVGFADAFPFLMLSEASLADLNRRLEKPVPMNRFRPNLVVSGCPPHAEDTWKRLAIGGVVFRVAKPCARCVITTVDQETGAGGPEPLRTLAAYRRDGNRVLFGQNLVHEGEGTLRAGDVVEILE